MSTEQCTRFINYLLFNLLKGKMLASSVHFLDILRMCGQKSLIHGEL
jgi:hypothetical protein